MLASVTVAADGTLPQVSSTVPLSATAGSIGRIVASDQTGAATPAVFGVTPFIRQLNASPSAAAAGDLTQISGSGFAPNSTVVVHLEDAAGLELETSQPVTTTDTGAIAAVQLSIPLTITAGIATINAIDSQGNVASSPLAVPAAGVSGLAVSPSFATLSESVVFTATGLPANENVQLFLGSASGQAIPLYTGSSLRADATGQVSGNFMLPPDDAAFGNPPAGRLPGSGANAGSLISVMLRGAQETLSAPLEVSGTSLAVTPSSTLGGQLVTIIGSGYRANEGVIITAVDSSNTVTLVGSAIASPSGSFSIAVAAPALSAGTLSTAFTIYATGETSGLVAPPAKLVVTAPPAIGLSNAVVQPGQNVRLTGTGFTPGSTVTVIIAAPWGANPRPSLGAFYIQQVVADGGGAFAVPVAVPATASVGPVNIEAIDTNGKAASAVLTVSTENASIVASAMSATPGNALTVRGRGFASGETVQISLDLPARQPQPLLGSTVTITAAADGTFTASYVPPVSQGTDATAVAPGGYLLTAQGEQSGREAVAGLEIVATGAVAPAATPSPVLTGCGAPEPFTNGGSLAGLITYFASGSTMVTSQKAGGTVTEQQELQVANTSEACAIVTVVYFFAPSGTLTMPVTREVSFTVAAHSVSSRSVNADAGNGRTFGMIVRAETGMACPSANALDGSAAEGQSVCAPGIRATLVTHRLLSGTPSLCSADQSARATAPACASAKRGAQPAPQVLDTTATSGVSIATPGAAASAGTDQGPSTLWYFATGDASAGYSEYLDLFNPGTAASTIQIGFYTVAGVTGSLAPLVLASGIQRTIDIQAAYRALIGCPLAQQKLPARCASTKDAAPLGMVVRSSQPIVAERALYWGSGSGSLRAGADVSPGVTQVALVSHYAYASTLASDQADLALIDPCTAGSRCMAQVSVNAYANSGLLVRSATIVVHPGRRATVPIAGFVPNGVYSLTVQSSIPIVSELEQIVGGSPTVGGHPGFVTAGAAGNTALTSTGLEAGQSSILIRVFNPTKGRMRSIRVAGLVGTSGPITTPDSTLAPNASLELAFPLGSAMAGKPVAVTVTCSSPCVASSIEGARGARVPLAAGAANEVWGAPMN